MSRFSAHHLLVVIALLFTVVLAAQSVNISVQANPAVTPGAWAYLPFIHGSGQAPPATPISTPTPTTTPTATNTPPPTNTPEPGRLASPTLFDIMNNDLDGNYTVGWSTVPDAEYYRLEQKRNNNDWKQIYEGPQREFQKANLSDGQYCYRAMALNAAIDSEWSVIKCTIVVSTTSTPTATNTPRPGELAAPNIFDIENSDGDGNFTVEWASVPGAEWYKLKENHEDTTWEPIHEGPTTSNSRINMPNGEYCYRVRAFNSEGYSEWSAIKCTYVGKATSTPTATPENSIECSFEVLKEGPYLWTAVVAELLDGRVLVAGGTKLSTVTNSISFNDRAYIFSPTSRKFYSIGNSPTEGYFAHVVLENGKVLLASNITRETSLDVFDPNTNLFTPTGHKFEKIQAMYELSDGKALLFSTHDPNIILYDPKSNTILDETTKVTGVNITDSLLIYEQGNEVVYSGGTAAESITIDSDNKIVQKSLFSGWRLPNNIPTVAQVPEKADFFVTGGYYLDATASHKITNEAYMRNLEDISQSRVGDMQHPRIYHTFTPLPNGNAIAIGGFAVYLNDLRDTVEFYDGTTQNFREAGNIYNPRHDHSVTVLKNGDIFVFGGLGSQDGRGIMVPPEIGQCKSARDESPG